MVSPTAPRKTKIFVGRLPENCRSDELRSLFVRFGEVTECDVMKRYGFVHMAREEDAAEAIKNLHNTAFKGATINVEQSTGKSRTRRDDVGGRRPGPMRGGRGGRDGGRDTRPGPYNDRRVMTVHNMGYEGQAGGGGSGGYGDYNRGGGDFGGRGDFGGGYNDRGGYGQNMGSGNMGYQGQTTMGGYGPAGGSVSGYGPAGGMDYSRNDYGRSTEFGGRADYGNRGDFPSGGMAAEFNRPTQGPVDYGRTENFGTGRTDAYPTRADYDRPATGPIRNGSSGVAAGAYSAGYGDVGPLSGAPSYNSGGSNYNAGPGPQADMFSRRTGGTVPSTGGYPVGGGYTEGYDRVDPYGPPRGGGRFPGPADAMPPRY
ncbi:hypothetical protein TKK_0010066 [Trichogramma kaykai]|uniref:RRM domain-containing protein n=1 Tax=Trichogramma kaykai TaxID=54128 RepID=A0ABD2WY67_9HYME